MRLYKVLLAEDESICRNGIVQMIPWEQLGFTISGVAEDGQDILDMIGQTGPDVLITDIKMPGMTGLQAIELLHERNIWVKTIILSGYADFAFAQRAIQDKAFAYVLKMDVVEELPRVLLQVKAELDAAGDSAPARAEESQLQEEDPIARSAQYIREHYAEPLRMEEAAKRAFMNPSYFSRLFKEKMGMNYSDMVTRVRLEKARAMLQDTRMRVSEVVRAVGYSDINYFIQRYRSAFGETPSHTRKR